MYVCVCVPGGWQPLLAATKAALQGRQQPPLVAVAASIPHCLLLPQCSAIVHHGGAGTCAAGLIAGLPHLIFPFHFDQFSWVWHCRQLACPALHCMCQCNRACLCYADQLYVLVACKAEQSNWQPDFANLNRSAAHLPLHLGMYSPLAVYQLSPASSRFLLFPLV